MDVRGFSLVRSHLESATISSVLETKDTRTVEDGEQDILATSGTVLCIASRSPLAETPINWAVYLHTQYVSSTADPFILSVKVECG